MHIASANLVSNYAGARIVFRQPVDYPSPPNFNLLRFFPVLGDIDAEATKTQVRILQFAERLGGKLLPHQKIEWNSRLLAKAHTGRKIVRRGIRTPKDYLGRIGFG